MIYIEFMALTASGEVHRMGDGVVSVDRQRHEHIGGGVRHHRLQEAYDLAEDVTGVPGHRNPPGDVGGHVD